MGIEHALRRLGAHGGNNAFALFRFVAAHRPGFTKTTLTLFIGAIVATGLNACSFGVDLTHLFDGTDAATIDAGLDSSPRDAGAEADVARCTLPNLLKNGDFESGATPWATFNSTIEASATARRTGTAGLQICRGPANSSYDGIHNFTPALPLAIYVARVWLRAPGGTAPEGQLYFEDRLGVTIAQQDLGSFGATWTCAEIQGRGEVAQFAFNGLLPGMATCFEADDAEMFLMPPSGMLPAECRCP
jgi:hypothetical protein